MRFVKCLLIATGLMGWGIPSLIASDAPPRYWKLTILHTNDTHGNLLPFNYPDPPDPNTQEAQLALRRNIGGIARRATLVRQLQKGFGTTWLVDTGDFHDGTAFSIEYGGEADVAAMNAVGYTIATHGNHEFNNPRARWQKLIEMARFPVVCANVVDANTKEPLMKPYEILPVEGARIAVFGGHGKHPGLPCHARGHRDSGRHRYGASTGSAASSASRHRDFAFASGV